MGSCGWGPAALSFQPIRAQAVIAAAAFDDPAMLAVGVDGQFGQGRLGGVQAGLLVGAAGRAITSTAVARLHSDGLRARAHRNTTTLTMVRPPQPSCGRLRARRGNDANGRAGTQILREAWIRRRVGVGRAARVLHAEARRRGGRRGVADAIVPASIVMPAKAGIHGHGPVAIGPGLRRDDTENGIAKPSLHELLAARSGHQ